MMEEIKEILVKQIFSDAFEEMLNNCDDFVKEQVLNERSRIFADGYYKALDDVIELIEIAQTYKMAVGSTDLFIDREAFRDEVLALKGEQE